MREIGVLTRYDISRTCLTALFSFWKGNLSYVGSEAAVTEVVGVADTCS